MSAIRLILNFNSSFFDSSTAENVRIIYTNPNSKLAGIKVKSPTKLGPYATPPTSLHHFVIIKHIGSAKTPILPQSI